MLNNSHTNFQKSGFIGEIERNELVWFNKQLFYGITKVFRNKET